MLIKFAFYVLLFLYSDLTAGNFIVLLLTADNRLLLIFKPKSANPIAERGVQLFSSHFTHLSSLKCPWLDCFSSGETRGRTATVVYTRCVFIHVFQSVTITEQTCLAWVELNHDVRETCD